LGKALAHFFHGKGATVIIHYHTSEKEAKALQLTLGERCAIYEADLRKESEINQLFTKIYEDHKKIDVLINTVGNFIYKPFEEVSSEDFADVMETNLQAAFSCSKQVLPKMMEQKSGQIINFGCAGADRMPIKELTTPYYIAKTGVIMLTKIMARTYASEGIQVNCISPGVLENSVADVAHIPAGRRATFEDICNAAYFLLSPEAAYCNGTNLEVAGGWTP
jgi:3-oxoacyl-[acyl-carrier protein] reductase